MEYLNENKRINQKYIQIKSEDKWVFEHRHKVELFIGRPLTVEETVHHIDKNKQNNSITNLMLFSNQNEHLKFHIYFDKYGFNQRIRRLLAYRWKAYKCKHL